MIEVVVAMTVIAIGILSTVAVSNVFVKASETNERRVVAVNLAREGIEAVRNIRDTNWQTYAAQQQNTALPPPKKAASEWDCFPGSPSDLNFIPFNCRGDGFSHLASSFPGDTSFTVYPLTLDATGAAINAAGYLAQQVGGSATTTGDSRYILCRPPPLNLYTPMPGANVADANSCPGKPYYRRIVIRSVVGADGSPNIKVQSRVTWRERADKLAGTPDQGDIVVEEYLTDWRKI